MDNLRVTLIQTLLHWEDPVANRAMLEEKIWKIGQPTDVILLPEMFTTGFTMNAAHLAEVMNLSTTKWMKQMADQTSALIMGSVIVNDPDSPDSYRDRDRYVNRLIWAEPGGKVQTYDKRHLFRMANEHTIYTGGESRLVGTWKGWRICPLVCYDLRFPVWSRNRWDPVQKALEYDLLVYVANWPKPRVSAWDTLLKARAMENLCFVAGVNRTGPDAEGIPYNGHSAVIDPRGASLWEAGEDETIHTAVLDAEVLRTHRERFPAFLDSDGFHLD